MEILLKFNCILNTIMILYLLGGKIVLQQHDK